jgi:hypothetical protein
MGVSDKMWHRANYGSDEVLDLDFAKTLSSFFTYHGVCDTYGGMHPLDPPRSGDYNPHSEREETSLNPLKWGYVAGTKGLCYTARR